MEWSIQPRRSSHIVPLFGLVLRACKAVTATRTPRGHAHLNRPNLVQIPGTASLRQTYDMIPPTWEGGTGEAARRALLTLQAQMRVYSSLSGKISYRINLGTMVPAVTAQQASAIIEVLGQLSPYRLFPVVPEQYGPLIEQAAAAYHERKLVFKKTGVSTSPCTGGTTCLRNTSPQLVA
eukprot:jgi/Botrbrau1/6833/Bobra.0153s0028.1